MRVRPCRERGAVPSSYPKIEVLRRTQGRSGALSTDTHIHKSSALGEGLWDGLLPAVLGFEDEFDYFAGGSVASGGVGDVVGGGSEFGGGVGYGYGESGALGEGDVGEVVSDPGGFFF